MRTRWAPYLLVSWMVALAAGWPLTALADGGTVVRAKRRPPATVAAVMKDGVRYVAAPSDTGEKPRRGGYVQAWDVGSGKMLWSRPVYWTRYDSHLETDVQDVFITRLEVAVGALVVENDLGERFEMDVATGRVVVRVKKSDRTEAAVEQERE